MKDIVSVKELTEDLNDSPEDTPVFIQVPEGTYPIGAIAVAQIALETGVQRAVILIPAVLGDDIIDSIVPID